MTERTAIEAEPREVVGKKVKQLRRLGIVPGTLYGEGEAVNVQMEGMALYRALRTAGMTSIIDFNLDGQARPVLVKEIQQHLTRGDVLHVDFYVVDMTRTIRLDVALTPIGEAAPQKEGLGVAVMVTRAAEIEALPSALISEFIVDLAQIDLPEDVIHLSDLVIPDGVTLISDPDTVVARFEFLSIVEEEEEEELVDEFDVEGEEPEVITKGKSEEEEIE